MKIKNVPEKLREDFKILCIRQRTNMSLKLIALMERAVKEELKKSS